MEARGAVVAERSRSLHHGTGGPRFESRSQIFLLYGTKEGLKRNYLYAANREKPKNRSRIAETTGWMRARVFARARSQKVELSVRVRL